MMRVAIVVAALALALPALAHNHWINSLRLTDPVSGEWCCNHIDCAPVKVGGVTETAGGYRVTETGEVIPHTRVIWQSQDGAWWRCRNMQTNATRCLIGPPPGS